MQELIGQSEPQHSNPDPAKAHHMWHHHMPFGFINLIFCRSLPVDEENIDPRLLKHLEPKTPKTPRNLKPKG